jgi:bifunctional ADP-heptose synthase (sugar kinase/adenylyltransferase)
VGGIRARVDTRSKILTLAAALELPPPLAIAAGAFDMLRAAHARELQSFRERTAPSRLLAALLPSARRMLAEPARAEMVAALRMVDYVVVAGYEDLHRLLCAHPGAPVVRLEAADALTAQLIDDVRRRHIP